jgi:hypothetical protein
VTTTVLQQTSGLSSSDWISLFSGMAMVFLTFALVYYARVAVVEGNKNRKKDSIEKQLENVYSPLYDILRRAKFAEDREIIRQYHSQREYALTEEEFKRVREIIERFGHYLGSQERMAIPKVLEQEHDLFLDSLVARRKYYRWRLVDIEKHWIFIWKTSEDLRRELEELTKRK